MTKLFSFKLDISENERNMKENAGKWKWKKWHDNDTVVLLGFVLLALNLSNGQVMKRKLSVITYLSVAMFSLVSRKICQHPAPVASPNLDQSRLSPRPFPMRLGMRCFKKLGPAVDLEWSIFIECLDAMFRTTFLALAESDNEHVRKHCHKTLHTNITQCKPCCYQG